MPTNAYQNYFENELQETSPLRLVEILYCSALDAIASARRHLRAGDISARSRCITKAMAIITELSISLNREAGGEISRNLAGLYAYSEKLLIQANFEQREQPLEEVERLLSTLLEAWAVCVRAQHANERTENDKSVANEKKLASEDYEPVSCAY
jgi:flagellar protein FliS